MQIRSEWLSHGIIGMMENIVEINSMEYRGEYVEILEIGGGVEIVNDRDGTGRRKGGGLKVATFPGGRGEGGRGVTLGLYIYNNFFLVTRAT
jgi:hypothetical protein